MPAEIPNRLEFLASEIEASSVNKVIGSSTKTDPVDPLAAKIRRMKFIWGLPIITLDFLNEDEKECGLCGNEYDKEFRVCMLGESPCCLPCGHVAGHACVREYLSPYESGFTKCPFCHVDFPQMTDVVEPAQPTSDLAWEDEDDYEMSDEELSRQISLLSRDSGVSNDEVQRYLSIDEVLSRSQTEGSGTGTVEKDVVTQAADPAEIGEDEFPKNRKNGGSPVLARAAVKAVDLLADSFGQIG